MGGRIDAVAGLVAAVIGENGGQDGSAGPGDPGQFGETGARVAEMVEHERGHRVIDGVGRQRQGMNIGGRGWRPFRGVPCEHGGGQVHRQDLGGAPSQRVAGRSGAGTRIQDRAAGQPVRAGRNECGGDWAVHKLGAERPA